MNLNEVQYLNINFFPALRKEIISCTQVHKGYDRMNVSPILNYIHMEDIQYLTTDHYIESSYLICTLQIFPRI